jgi:hypothetical protein
MATTTFWSEASTEPKRKFRWTLSLSTPDLPGWIIKKVTKPTFTVSEVKHSYINHSFYYPGRIEYNEIEFTLVDPVDPDAAAEMMAILAASGYEVPTSAVIGKQTMTKAEATHALGEIYIRQIDGDANTIEKWTLTNAWVKEVNFGDLDYESDDIGEIVVKMRYDWATHSAGD